MDYLELFNRVAKVARPPNTKVFEIKDLDLLINDTGYDSLDMLMIGVYLSDIFGVSEEVAKTMKPKSVRDMMEFFVEHATKTPESIDSAIKQIK